MNNYEKTIQSFTEVKALASHLATVRKIMATSEDGQLYNSIANVVFALQFHFQNSIAKATPTSLMFHRVPATVQLPEHRAYQIRLKRPECQVLAA